MCSEWRLVLENGVVHAVAAKQVYIECKVEANHLHLALFHRISVAIRRNRVCIRPLQCFRR